VQTARERGYDREPQHLAAVERLLANRVREEHRESQKLEITDAEIEARYRAEQKKFTVPAKIRAAMIFVEAPATFTEEKRAERRAAIEEARAKALADPSQFRALAAEYSYDQTTKFRGGDLGYLVEGTGAEELDLEVISAAFALKEPGAIGEIVSSKKGFYLLQLTERSAATVRPLANVAPQIRADLQREKQQRADQQFETALTANRKIESRRDRLTAIPRAATDGADAPVAPPVAPSLRTP
jgi:parvulin-like peptidyl-prolyl isomerase